MEVLLVAATAFEIRPVTEKLHLMARIDGQTSRFRYRDLTADILVTGVGMTATAFSLGRQLKDRHYDLAINAGIAGSFRKHLAPGSMVHVVSDCFSDLGAEDGERFLTVFDLGLTDPDTFPYKGGKLLNDLTGKHGSGWSEKLQYLLVRLMEADGITVNTVHGNIHSIKTVLERVNPDVETMEGAAFLYACMTSGVPCCQIRAVSNYVEERDTSRWNVDLALKNLNETMFEMISLLTG